MVKLVLSGCSWVRGVWGLDDPNDSRIHVVDDGMSRLLSDRYATVNLGRGNGSLWQTLYSISNYLVNGYSDDTKIIVFQTDAFRQAGSDRFDVNYADIINQSSDLNNFYQRVLEIYYIKLNQIAERHNRKFFVSGGFTDLDTDLISEFNKLEILCPSWIKLMYNDHVPNTKPLIMNKEFLPYAKKMNRWDLVEEIIKWSDSAFPSVQEIMDSQYFGPHLHDYHPNLIGHSIMADYINNFLQETQS